jgi:hypothetical protein
MLLFLVAAESVRVTVRVRVRVRVHASEASVDYRGDCVASRREKGERERGG